MKPLISIVLPIYNVEKYLPICMDSLERQTYRNLEIIMVNDGSKDNCFNMCNMYGNKNPKVIVYHKENGGLSDARNYGIERAHGKYITFIDPDDYVDTDYVEYLYHLLVKYNTKLSICQHRIVYNNGKIKELGSLGNEIIGAKECINRMLYHDVIDTSAWAKLYSLELFKDIKYPKGKIFEDIATTYRLMMLCDNIACGYESKYSYVFHNNSIINSKFKLNKLNLIEMTDNMGRNVVNRFPELSDAVLRRRVYSRISTLNHMLKTNEYPEIRKRIVTFIKVYRCNILKDAKAPIRDKAALIILTISFRLYRMCWLKYQSHIMTIQRRN